MGEVTDISATSKQNVGRSASDQECSLGITSSSRCRSTRAPALVVPLTGAHFQGDYCAEHAVCGRFEKRRAVGSVTLGCA
jgi:hypothetical protein